MKLIKKSLLLIPLFWFVFWTIYLFRNTLFPPPNQIILGQDISSLLYFQLLQMKDYILQGFMPYWNQYNFSGLPLLANPAGGALFYPFNILFIVLPLSMAFSWYQVIHIILAGLAMYWFMNKRVDRISALTSASIYAFSGYMAAHTYMGHIESLAAMAYLPIIFGSFEKLFRRFTKQYFMLAISSLALQILTGTHIMVLFTLELTSLYLAFVNYNLLIKKQGKEILKNIIAYLSIILFALGICGYQLVPVFEYAKQSIRNVGLPYEIATKGSLTLGALLFFISPYHFGGLPPKFDVPYQGPWPNPFEYIYFVSLIPMGLIFAYTGGQLISFIKKRAIDRNFLFYFAVSSFFLLMAFGSNLPLYEFFYNNFPPIRFFRMPMRQLSILVFIFSVLAGKAIFQIKAQKLKICLLFACTLEVVLFYKNFIQLTFLPATDNPQLINKIKQNLRDGRIYPQYLSFYKPAYFYDVNAGFLSKIPSVGGYNELILEKYFRFFQSMSSKRDNPLLASTSELPLVLRNFKYLDFLGVKYLIVPAEEFEKSLKQATNFVKREQVSPGYFLVENTNDVSNFQLVRQVLSFSSDTDLENLLDNGLALLQTSLLATEKELQQVWQDYKVELSQPCNNIEAQKIRLIKILPNEIILDVFAPCAGFLSTNQAYYPGWRASLSDKSTPVLRANLAFRAIYVPSGQHQIKFYYSPIIYVFGFFVSILSIFALIVVYFKFLKKTP